MGIAGEVENVLGLLGGHAGADAAEGTSDIPPYAVGNNTAGEEASANLAGSGISDIPPYADSLGGC